ncbi:hypothetical protein D0B54_11210 [Solimonas sp. K1W22B-7]|uniref:NHL domain-containing protein n=1 Tax=Solimonas sp. K1W22B-7 TaxID=2303331 RepID=UPI000E33305D|nr:RHS repeat-associated core domain-containing protein [Solimonas sp. K1W22B-7]AXQ29222.1 hypothetical protein D0B54_11210 [Solimonas sp. K1W22B-7]
MGSRFAFGKAFFLALAMCMTTQSHAQSEGEALWIGEKTALVKLDPATGQRLARLTQLTDVRAAAIDERGGVMWVYSSHRLLRLGLDGAVQKTIALPQISGMLTLPFPLLPPLVQEDLQCSGEGAIPALAPDSPSFPMPALAVEPVDGAVWLAVANRLFKFDFAGQKLAEVTLDGVAVDVAYDRQQNRTWVAQCRKLKAFDASGQVVATLPVLATGERMPLRAIDYDPTSNELWVALSKRLRRYSADGSRTLDVARGSLRSVRADQQGGAWVADGTTLQHVSAAGAVAASVTPFPGLLPKYISSLAIDLSRGGVWVLAKDTLRYVDSAGTLQFNVTAATIGAGFLPQLYAVAPMGDLIPPDLSITSPLAEAQVATRKPLVVLQYVDLGSGVDPSSIEISANGVANAVACTHAAGGSTCTLAQLPADGTAAVAASVADMAGNRSETATVTFTVDTVPPPLPNDSGIAMSPSVGGNTTVTGGAGAVEGGINVVVTNVRTGQRFTVRANADGSFSLVVQAAPDDVLKIVSEDAAGNRSGQLERTVAGVSPPPDPSTVAPPLVENGSTPFASTVDFLYTGGSPIQTGVASATIYPDRVAVLRGQVRTRAGAALSGVVVKVLNHPEFGQTLTRTDGVFDLAVNGGATLTLDYQKNGYLPLQRQVSPGWKSYKWADDVVMIGFDPQVTEINLADQSQSFQVARSSVTNDASGSRQATMLFPSGMTAQMELPNGQQQALTQMNVRATEYTVGSNGSQAMPGNLPRTSGYTYAAELSVDQAVAAGATTVRFSKPVIVYIDNFLNFPAGQTVPVGYYDRQAGVWRASENGKVVKIIGTQSGRAVLDVTGNGQAATQAALDALGITQPELQQLAQLYSVGKSMWRSPISHFTPDDWNWPYGPPMDARKPPRESPDKSDKHEPKDSDEECDKSGCVISAQTRSLKEHLPIPGTALSLTYGSDRVPGYAKNSMRIRLTDGAAQPASLKSISVEIEIAGRKYVTNYPGAPNLFHNFTWTGYDGYHRKQFGTHDAKVKLVHHYPCQYYATLAGVQNAWATIGDADAILGVRNDGCDSADVFVEWAVSMESPFKFKAQQSVGTWSLNPHHAYEPSRGSLHFGDGRRSQLAAHIETVAGGGAFRPSYGDGGPATDAHLVRPGDVVAGPDGSLYITDMDAGSVRKVNRNGIITRFAGMGQNGWRNTNDDGGLATQAYLHTPFGVDVDAAGNVYIADTYNALIRKVSPSGIITTIAGTGAPGFSGDGGPATAAELTSPQAVAIDAMGNIYVADTYAHRVRKIDSDGIITTVAGTGERGRFGNGGPATEAQLDKPDDIAVDAAGNLYIAEALYRVRRVRPDGIIEAVAGTDQSEFSGDGGLATIAGLNFPYGIDVDAIGNIYIADCANARVRKIDVRGIISTVAGKDPGGFSGDGGLPTAADMGCVFGISVDAAGNIYTAETGNQRVRKITSESFIGFPADAESVNVPSSDGSEVYVFNKYGFHQRTLNAYTGAILLSFGYDAENRLLTLTDADGNVTTIERDGRGEATAIVAPDGQRTTVTVDGNGDLASLTYPNGSSWSMDYDGAGLLTRFETPNGHANAYAYDGDGRLNSDVAPNEGGWQLARESLGDSGYRTTMTSGEGRVSSFTVQLDALNARVYTDKGPDGLASMRRYLADVTTVEEPDGTVTTAREGPDPRFQLFSPLITDRSIATPSGLMRQQTLQRTVQLQNPADSLSLISQTDLIGVNGRQSSQSFDAATNRWTGTSAGGRSLIQDVDEQGRALLVQGGGLAPIHYSYDTRGRLSDMVVGNGAAARAWSFTYYGDDAGAQAGRLASATDPAERTTSFEYDAAGRLTAEVLPGNRRVEYGHDPNGNLTALKPPGSELHAYEYDNVDQVDGYLPPEVDEDEIATRYHYNRDKQLTSIVRPDGELYELSYDGSGRLQSLSTAPGAIVYSYHPVTGQLSNMQSPGGTLSYTYDGFLPTSESISGLFSATVSRSYDNNFWLRSLSVNGEAVSFDYDADGLLIQAGEMTLTPDAQNGLLRATALGDLHTSQSFNVFGELEDQQASYDGDALYSAHYVRDELGRIAEKQESVQGEQVNYGYAYDTPGRLVQVTINGAIARTYVYDDNGNRRWANATEGTYDAQDRLLTYGAVSYSHNANGERKTRTEGVATTRYDYDALGNLWRVELPGDVVIDYRVDGRNRRIAKKVNGTTVQGFVYQDQLNPIAELDGSGNVVARFVYADKGNVPSYMVKGGQAYRIISDQLGSPRIVVDANTGEVVQRMDYDEFGGVTQDTNPGFQPFGFAGGLHDQHTQLLRFGARDYDPETARWTAKDPIGFGGGDSNLYAYVGGDSVNYVDPFGLEIAIVVNGPTSGNPFGHAAIAVTGAGVYSFGNDTNLGSSLTDYLERQAPLRDTEIRIIPTTTEQERETLDYLKKFSDRNGVGYFDNCAVRTGDALRAADIPVRDPLATSSFPEGIRRAMNNLPGITVNIPRNGSVPANLSSFNPK